MIFETHDKNFNRRLFLKSASATIPIPFFASLCSSAEADDNINKHSKVKRLVSVATDYGMYRGSLIPDTAGTLKLPKPAAVFSKFSKKMSVFSGMDHPGVGGGHGCAATFLNGMYKNMTRGDRKKMISLDMYLADRLGDDTRYRILCCGAGAPLTWNRKGISVPKVGSTRQLFSLLFAKNDPKTAKRRKASIKDERSILDDILEDSKKLSQKLDSTDKQKFVEYLDAVRSAEVKLVSEDKWLETPKPSTKVNPFALKNGDESLHDYELFYEIIALALQTDSTRFVTFQMPGGNSFLPVDGVTMAYHNMTHHGNNPEHVKQLSLVDNWRFTHLSRLLNLLETYKSPDGKKLIDSTMVLYGSGMADASTHSPKRTPIALFGGDLKHGKHHALGGKDKKHTPVANLFVSMIHKFGIDTKNFSSSTGNLNHLLT